jgi:hypothetical protein
LKRADGRRGPPDVFFLERIHKGREDHFRGRRWRPFGRHSPWGIGLS